jgi:uncharacterized protein (DUF2267 family)
MTRVWHTGCTLAPRTHHAEAPMSQLEIDTFDKTLQKSNEWIHELMRELGWSDAHQALGVFRSVVHAIRDRLPVPEAVALAAEMPMLLRGLYFEGWRPVEHVPVLRHRGELLALLEERLGESYGLYGEDTVTSVTRAVLRVLNRHISRGEIENARHTLPVELRALWPAAPLS